MIIVKIFVVLGLIAGIVSSQKYQCDKCCTLVAVYEHTYECDCYPPNQNDYNCKQPTYSLQRNTNEQQELSVLLSTRSILEVSLGYLDSTLRNVLPQNRNRQQENNFLADRQYQQSQVEYETPSTAEIINIKINPTVTNRSPSNNEMDTNRNPSNNVMVTNRNPSNNVMVTNGNPSNNVLVTNQNPTNNDMMPNPTNQLNEFYWMVAILDKSIYHTFKFSEHYKCDGTLIKPSVVLTAAHCVGLIDSNKFKVRAGQFNSEDSSLYEDRNVAKISKNNKYNENNYHNYDIVLLLLREPFELTSNINVINLPPRGLTYNLEDCITVSWNKQEQYFNKISKLSKIPNNSCEKILQRTRLLKENFQLDSSNLCLSNAGKNTCFEDGGSPLICPIDSSNYAQIGILSRKFICDQKHRTPEMYTDLTNLVEWINTKSENYLNPARY